MPTPTAEIVDRQGTVDYLTGLVGNLDQTTSGELELLAAGWASAGFADPAVLGPVAAGRELLASAREQFAQALEQLTGVHAAVSEAVDAAGADRVARDSAYYGSH